MLGNCSQEKQASCLQLPGEQRILGYSVLPPCPSPPAKVRDRGCPTCQCPAAV